MVSTKLVDGRANPSTYGWSFYLVEVHHSRLSPIMGLDRLWRRFDRLDTVPYIRSLGTVAVVGDTMVIGVGGSSATAWSYDVRTKQLTRSPTPDWLNAAWVTPPPAFSPDGRFIAYLSQESDTSRFTVRSWPDGRIVAQSPPVQPRQLNPPHGGTIFWRNPRELEASVSVSDSGPSIASLQGVVRDGAVEIEKWSIYPDYSDPNVHRPVLAPEAPAAATDTAPEDQWTRAAREIRRFPPDSFQELPAAFRAELDQRGCSVPQSDFDRSPTNVIHGSFGTRGQNDWAVLCSRAGTSVILVWWSGPAQCPREFEPFEDKHFLQSFGGGRIDFSRAITPAQTYHVYPGDDTAAVEREVELEHDGIEDAFQGKGSTVWFCKNGKWISFSGAD